MTTYKSGKSKKNYYKNYSNPAPELEKVNVGDELSITINASETFGKLNEYIRHYIYLMKHYMIPYMEIKEMYPELSPKGRLHYHGIVKFTSLKKIIAWYFQGQHIKGFNISLDTITDSKKWKKYIKKQYKHMKPVCKIYKLTTKLVEQQDPQPLTPREQFKRGSYQVKEDLDFGL